MSFECLGADSSLVPCLARFFSWDDLSKLCSTLLSDGLQRTTVVTAVGVDCGDAWELKLVHAPISKEEQETLMNILDTDDFEQEANDFGVYPIWEISFSVSHKLVARVLPFHVEASHASDDGVWFTGCAESETPGSVYAVNVIRLRTDGLDTEVYFSNYLVDKRRLAAPTPKACEDLLRKIAADFLQTEDGRDAYAETCEDFNWGDMETYIPDAFFKPYGVSRPDGRIYPYCDVIGVIVNQDELLGDCSLEDTAL